MALIQNHSTKKWLVGIFFSFAMSPVFVSAADPESGKELYHEVEINQTINGVNYTNANCDTCHSSEVFTRSNRLATTYKKLEAFVERCNTNLDVGWFPEDVSDVSSYLNDEFYKLEH
ncbi:MAG: hypothetical protein ACRBB6_06810 [Neptuniibacter sp.]